jgi:hypothetical protein
MWESIGNFLRDNFATEIFAFILGAVIVSVFSYFQYRRRYNQSLRDLTTGLDTERVLGQLNLLAEQDGAFVLRLFNLPGRTTVAKLFETNLATQTYMRQLVRKTTLSNPILPFEGVAGKNALHEIFNHFACQLGLWSHPTRDWLFVVTCEDGEFLERKQIRCFFLLEETLLRFLDWEFCKSVQVTSQLHAYRIVALRNIALVYQKQREDIPSMSARQEGPSTVTQIKIMSAALPATLPRRESSPVDWTVQDLKKVLAAANVVPAELPATAPDSIPSPMPGASAEPAGLAEEEKAPASEEAQAPAAEKAQAPAPQKEQAPQSEPAAETASEEAAPEKRD